MKLHRLLFDRLSKVQESFCLILGLGLLRFVFPQKRFGYENVSYFNSKPTQAYVYNMDTTVNRWKEEMSTVDNFPNQRIMIYSEEQKQVIVFVDDNQIMGHDNSLRSMSLNQNGHFKTNTIRWKATLFTSPKKPIFPTIQPVFPESIKNMPLKIVVSPQTQNYVFSMAIAIKIVCCNIYRTATLGYFFIIATKAGAIIITPVVIKTKMDWNLKLQKDIRKERHKNKNTLILQFFHPILKEDFVLCCKQNILNVPIGSVGKVIEIFDSQYAKCEFKTRHYSTLAPAKQNAILTQFGSKTRGSGLLVNKQFLKQIDFDLL